VEKVDSLSIPKEELVGVRRWSPNSLAERGPGAERRAANQAGGPRGDPAQAELALAREEAIRQGFASGRELALEQAARLRSIATGLQDAAALAEQDLAEAVLRLGIDLARNVIRSELQSHPEALLACVRDALSGAPEVFGTFELLLHPEDVEIVRTALEGETHLGNWRIIPDPGVGRGGCRLTSRSGDIDATLATRWRQALAQLGREDPLEPGS